MSFRDSALTLIEYYIAQKYPITNRDLKRRCRLVSSAVPDLDKRGLVSQSQKCRLHDMGGS